MPAPWHDQKPSTADAVGHFFGERGRRKLVAVTDRYCRGASNAPKIRTGVRPGHVQVQMSDKSLGSAFQCHRPIQPSQGLIAVSHERHDIVSLRLGVCDFGDRLGRVLLDVSNGSRAAVRHNARRFSTASISRPSASATDAPLKCQCTKSLRSSPLRGARGERPGAS
jgi:hypothetical protein